MIESPSAELTTAEGQYFLGKPIYRTFTGNEFRSATAIMLTLLPDTCLLVQCAAYELAIVDLRYAVIAVQIISSDASETRQSSSLSHRKPTGSHVRQGGPCDLGSAPRNERADRVRRGPERPMDRRPIDKL